MSQHTLFTTLLLLLLLTCSFTLTTTQSLSDTFQTWKLHYNKTYRDEKEEAARKQIYLDNKKFVSEYKDEGDVVLELGPFADLTHSEFLGTAGVNLGQHTGVPAGQGLRRGKFAATALFEEGKVGEGSMTCEVYKSSGGAAPTYINWKDKGAVTGVLKQSMNCPGNSYAIAALGAVTGQWYQKSGRRIAFSEQQVVDCSRKSGNLGCLYGSARRTYSYISSNGGIATRLNYPTTGAEGQCKTNVPLGPTITGCRTITPGDERTMKELVGKLGPVTAVLDISARSFQFYRSGVYYERTCHAPYATHHVLVTGYGREYDRGLGRVVDYWRVKNSWGAQWGERGYMKIIRNSYNHCGIANTVTLPIVDK